MICTLLTVGCNGICALLAFLLLRSVAGAEPARVSHDYGSEL